MKNDIVPRNKTEPSSLPKQNLVPPVDNQPPERPAQINASPSDVTALPHIDEPTAVPEKPRKKRLKWIVVGCIALIIVCTLGLALFLLGARDSSAEGRVPVEIVSGMVPSQIADTLEDEGVIRSSLAFLLFMRLSGAQDSLQAGNYTLSPADSVPEIVSQLQAGPEADEIEVTFRPGETLAANKKELESLGYSSEEINTAFAAAYDHPLFEDKPAGADLEGYIFGETHRFVTGTPVETVLKRYFDDYYAVITENNLTELYKQQGLSLFEGITLASIVQRESGGDDKNQIAQVFLLRLSTGMELGSDVTYQYIADKEGKPRDVNYDSPYNTRRYSGLPPGPIASPGVAALKAVGSPASGDYLYFLSGDDNITYFARTLAEHEANIRDHCQEKCQIL